MNTSQALSCFAHRIAVPAVALSVLASCGAGTERSLAPPTPPTDSAFSEADVEPPDRLVDSDGRLIIPTTTTPVLVIPARVAEELQTEGIKADVIVGPPPEEDPDETPTCTLRLIVEADVLEFEYNSDEISGRGRIVLELMALEMAGALTVKVVGHASSDGADDYNLELSLRRAAAVATILSDLLEASFVVEGMGETKPTASNDTEEGRSQNRRVEITAEVQRPECDRGAAS